MGNDQVRFDFPLPRTARLLVSGLPIKIVALGSSSTYGVGASTLAASYPSRLAEELVRRFPGQKFTVLNRGVSGEDLSDMLARLDTAVIRQKPDLVLGQLGTNSVLDGKAVRPQASLLRKGLARLKATGADVVLIDPQYVPEVIAKRHAYEMVSLIATIAKEERVDHFRRFDLMRHWHETEHLPFKRFVSPDGLHMNDWSTPASPKGSVSRLPRLRSGPPRLRSGRASRPIKAVLRTQPKASHRRCGAVFPTRECIGGGFTASWHIAAQSQRCGMSAPGGRRHAGAGARGAGFDPSATSATDFAVTQNVALW